MQKLILLVKKLSVTEDQKTWWPWWVQKILRKLSVGQSRFALKLLKGILSILLLGVGCSLEVPRKALEESGTVDQTGLPGEIAGKYKTEIVGCAEAIS